MEKTTVYISSIQHFSVGDGPGIRTTVFFMGCPLKCPWCHNPETRSMMHTLPGKCQEISISDVLKEVLEDVDFYCMSGGGLTIGGGEAMCQPEGVTALAKAAKEHGISVCIDTAGDVPWSHFSMVLPYTDCFLYDVKTADPARAKDVLGADLPRILENLRRLIEAGKDVRVRIPLIPGFNMDKYELEQLYKTIRESGARTVDILPFHRLGFGKYEALGIDNPMADTLPPTMAEVRAAAEVFAPEFTVTIEQ
ncbi:MAG: glycyl-radical enzyme activating protein [Ruminococcaceae bacterium]|nr:glycyl-radical enzyme activating protein [Oscillospiraceae bacterium]